MFKIIQVYGVPEKVIQTIRLMYQNTNSKISTSDGQTKMPGTKAVVLQDDKLAYFVFVKFFGYVMRKAIGEDVDKSDIRVKRLKSCRCKQRTISDIEFAYDITWLSEATYSVDFLQRKEEKRIALA